MLGFGLYLFWWSAWNLLGYVHPGGRSLDGSVGPDGLEGGSVRGTEVRMEGGGPITEGEGPKVGSGQADYLIPLKV